jgi:hypothetical protein
MEPQDLLPYLGWLIGGITVISVAGIAASVYSLKLKIKHGYPLKGSWGSSLKPSGNAEAKERITLLTQENAKLRAEIGSLGDRLVNVERIVTDTGFRVEQEIERLRDHPRSVEGRKKS